MNVIFQTDDNIPLRIMLLLMDEVFDLKSRNQWLRRRIVTLLRQIIRTMFGDIVNRRITDYVALMTSPEQVADYLRAFQYSFLSLFFLLCFSVLNHNITPQYFALSQACILAEWNESRTSSS